MKLIANNKIESGLEVEDLVRDGKFIKRPDGRFVITQGALESFLLHAEQATKRLALIDFALKQGADVESGALDAGIFNEIAKKVNWRKEFVRVKNEEAAKAITAESPKLDNFRTRVFTLGDKKATKGIRVAPTPDGLPPRLVEKAEEEGESAE